MTEAAYRMLLRAIATSLRQTGTQADYEAPRGHHAEITAFGGRPGDRAGGGRPGAAGGAEPRTGGQIASAGPAVMGDRGHRSGVFPNQALVTHPRRRV